MSALSDKAILYQIRSNLLEGLSDVSDIDKINRTLYCVHEVNACLKELSE